ncbi:hypothetical protein [Paraburkholderia sp. RL17-337-BIB-A]|uniref:hypothetical protein n=1 Tax=Paraburkholderia sp. RL17-337-BIB-A TaxID=3031636 RepID=UPI0038BA673D
METKPDGQWFLPLRHPKEMSPPDNLTGETGVNRAPASGLRMSAKCDWQAAEEYLESITHHCNGWQDSSRRAIERLFLWSWIEARKPVSSLLYTDFQEYAQFLRAPQPRDFWCGAGSTFKLADERWRPFWNYSSGKRPATDSSALIGLFNYWVVNGYIIGNPIGDCLRVTKRILRRERGLPQGSSDTPLLDSDTWRAMALALEELRDGREANHCFYERTQFVLKLIYFLAPKANELILSTMNSFRREGNRWWWHVGQNLRPGQPPLKMPVPEDLLAALERYRRFRGLEPLPSSDDYASLITNARSAPLSRHTLNTDVQSIRFRAADRFGSSLTYKANHLRTATIASMRSIAFQFINSSGTLVRYIERDWAAVGPGRTYRPFIGTEDECHDKAQKQKWPDLNATP